MEPPPAVRKRGCGPVGIVSVTVFVFGSTRDTRLFSVLLIQIAPSSPKTHAYEPDGTLISAVRWFVAGSILERMPVLSVSIHTLSALVASPPSLCAGPYGHVATTLFLLMSTRESVLSVQLGAQMLPKPAARPEHGRFPTSIVAATVFVFTSSLWIVFLGPFATQTESSVRTCQSGVP